MLGKPRKPLGELKAGINAPVLAAIAKDNESNDEVAELADETN